MKPALSLGVMFLFAATLPLAAHADPKAPADDETGENTSGRWVFSLTPKAFQKNPSIDMAIITEMTPAGRKLAPPTAAHPAYYIPYSAGYHDEGQGVTGEHPVPVETLQAQLQKSLLTTHYLPSDPLHAPSLAIIFIWGSANKYDTSTNPGADGVPDNAADRVDVAHQNLLSRAALVGGEKFAHEYAEALTEEDKMLSSGVRNFGPKPTELFMRKSSKNRELVEEAKDDCYYVVASAYDAALLAKGTRVLLWRTKMTTNSLGLAMAQSLPTLMVSGGAYFGKDMAEAATLTRHLIPEGHVEIGTPTEVEKPAGPAPAK